MEITLSQRGKEAPRGGSLPTTCDKLFRMIMIVKCETKLLLGVSVLRGHTSRYAPNLDAAQNPHPR
ncbi:hypothetical protein DZA28_04175 [Pseudomonas alloputida]|uniref:Uncharacterized protein n=2 Tax=Pseudomonas TaxID=286 RepID=A0ABD6MT55_9PSED|nr:hypothetical protein [Pseudomonas sp.]NWL44354.1 hypothetical protein [Pseudomonas hunanensis]PTV58432.1 hypothetical protein DBL03_18395 [Pseudomonas putida]TRO37480.1 hypothetical protein EQ845_08680 [Pseudomonas putida]TRZ59183.1 hypothetical protein DZA28_04175 [Pseudomonas alloputida]